MHLDSDLTNRTRYFRETAFHNLPNYPVMELSLKA